MESNGERGRISEQERSAQGLAITSFVLGILSVFLSVFLVGGALAVIGFIFGAVHLIQKRRPRLMAWFGTVLSVFGIVATSVIAFAYFQFFSSFLAEFQDAGFGSTGTDYSKWEGVMAPDITVTTLEGETITLSELKGRRVVLDFWATWCPPCREEIPHFIELTKELDASDLLIVGISDEDEGTIQTFLDEMPVNYPMVSADNLPAPFTNIAAIPTTFFIDRNGVIQSVQVGYHDLNFLRELATAEDFQGTPLESPREASDAPQSGLLESDAPLTSLTLWSLDIPGVDALCVGDWDADGVDEVLYERNKTLHIVGLEGTEEASVTLPDTYSRIEMGWHKEEGPRLLGEIGNGDKIQVMDESGKKIWSYDYWGGD